MSGNTESFLVENVDISQIKIQESSSKIIIDSKEKLDELLKSEDGNKKAKEIIRSHCWPASHPIRRHLWLLLCEHHSTEKHLDSDSFYDDQTKELKDNLAPRRLPEFVDDHYMNNYCLNEEGKQGVKRILHVLSDAHPGITYSPLVYPITSLFLHFYNESQAYSCISSLLNSKTHSFIGQTRAMFLAQAYVVMKLTKKFERKAFANILQVLDDANDVVSKVFLEWSKWIFNDLPFHYVVKIMDCFLMEGSKFLYRIALAIMLLFTRNEGRSEFITTEQELGEKISKFCKELQVPVEKLIKTAVSIKGLSRKEVTHQIEKSHIYFKDKDVPLPKRKAEGEQKSTMRMPVQHFVSEILSQEQVCTLWEWLPSRITVYKPQVVYSSNENGSSLTAFYMRVDPWESTLLLVKTTNNEVFGAYCSAGWACRNEKDEKGNHKTYFGTGETFLFTLVPEVKRYSWIGIKQREDLPHSCQLFMTGNLKMICVGSGNGQALWLDESLASGKTEHCDTFDNEPLCSKNFFECSLVEVVAFQSTDN